MPAMREDSQSAAKGSELDLLSHIAPEIRVLEKQPTSLCELLIPICTEAYQKDGNLGGHDPPPSAVHAPTSDKAAASPGSTKEFKTNSSNEHHSCRTVQVCMYVLYVMYVMYIMYII